MKSSNKLKICLNIVTERCEYINPDVEQVCATKKQEKLPCRYIIENYQYLPKDLKVCWGLLKLNFYANLKCFSSKKGLILFGQRTGHGYTKDVGTVLCNQSWVFGSGSVDPHSGPTRIHWEKNGSQQNKNMWNFMFWRVGGFHCRAEGFAAWKQSCGSASLLCGSGFCFLFDADPDPTFHSDANPDPTFQFLMRIRIGNISLTFIHCKIMHQNVWIQICTGISDTVWDTYGSVLPCISGFGTR